MLKIKVCGMKFRDNVELLSRLPIDYMGCICYPKSPRYIGVNNTDLQQQLSTLSPSIGKVGVFVGADLDQIRQAVEEYHFDLVQLHGGESPEFCSEVQDFVPVIKAFSIADETDLARVSDYENTCSQFLFDTKTSAYGGSGKKFDWKLLERYVGATPFLLSGGIGLEDVPSIKELAHPLLWGVDLNSKFETAPGLKNINQLETFIKQLNDESYT